MQALDVQPETVTPWLALIEHEYFRDYLPEGGAAVKFAVADEAAAHALPGAVAALAEGHGMLAVSVSAGTTRLHMLQDLFFAVARALPWDTLVQHFVEDLFARNGYDWPRPGEAVTMAELAAGYDVAPALLARTRDQWLSRELWDDTSLAQDFRAAMLSLCLARMEPDSAGVDLPVKQWLCGEKVGLALLKPAEIGARITRTNARAMLVSLCHFLRKTGAAGLALVLDIRPALRVAPADQAVRYSPAAVMDLYEVLRELIDDIEHLPGLFVLAIADPALIEGDRRRTLDTYKALEMRIFPDVRPGDRQNPLAPLVRVAA